MGDFLCMVLLDLVDNINKYHTHTRTHTHLFVVVCAWKVVCAQNTEKHSANIDFYCPPFMPCLAESSLPHYLSSWENLLRSKQRFRVLLIKNAFCAEHSGLWCWCKQREYGKNAHFSAKMWTNLRVLCRDALVVHITRGSSGRFPKRKDCGYLALSSWCARIQQIKLSSVCACVVWMHVHHLVFGLMVDTCTRISDHDRIEAITSIYCSQTRHVVWRWH